MQASSIPVKMTIPFANNAGGSYIRQVPTPSQIPTQAGAASFYDGFPPLTFVPPGAGGTPPFGQDFNGILNQTTAWSQWYQAGVTAQYDSNFSRAVNGYPEGAVLSSTVTPGLLFYCTADNNTVNPDVALTNWLPFGPGYNYAGRLLNIQIFTSGGTYTPTTGMTKAIVQAVGGGGGSGGLASTSSGQWCISPGASAGAYAQVLLTASQIGTSQTISIGTGGSPGASGGGSAGGNGGTTTFGSIISCPGGIGSIDSGPASYVAFTAGVNASSGRSSLPTISEGTVIISAKGMPGQFSSASTNAGGTVGGMGGGSPLTGGGTGYGAGGDGAAQEGAQSAVAGNAGTAGVVIVYEYS